MLFFLVFCFAFYLLLLLNHVFVLRHSITIGFQISEYFSLSIQNVRPLKGKRGEKEREECCCCLFMHTICCTCGAGAKEKKNNNMFEGERKRKQNKHMHIY